MPTTQPAPPPRPILARAAENGLYLSVFICILMLLLGIGTQTPLVGLLFWIGAVAMPFAAYRLLSRNCMRAGASLSFAEIWAEGIASFFLGSLLPAVVAYALLRFAFPAFIANQVNVAYEAFKAIGTPEGNLLADTMDKMRTEGLLPTPADIAANIISLNIVGGTVLSLFMAIILSARIRMRRASRNKINN